MPEEPSDSWLSPGTKRLLQRLITGIIIGLTIGLASSYLKGGF